MRHQRRRVPSDRVGSWRARWVARALSVGVRPLVEVLPDSPAGIRTARRVVAGFLAVVSRPDPQAVVTRIDEPAAGGARVRGEWVRVREAAAPGEAPRSVGVGPAVFYVHGSGFAVASARTHRGITSRLARLTGLPVFACDYRLAPSHRFPAAADDVEAAFGWLLEQGVDPARVVLAGDSAGGHLVVDLAAELRRTGRPGPAGLVLFSPLIDLSFARARARERRAGRDPMVSVARAQRLVSLHLRAADPASPRLRFTPDTVAGLAPMLIHAGGAEVLADDATHLTSLVRAAGGEAQLRVWPGQVHVFQALTGVVPEATRALHEAAAFIHRQLLEGRPRLEECS